MTELENSYGETPSQPIVAAPESHSAPTIYDVAELAGVNPSTVSRALTKPGRVSVKTEEKIRQAAKQLNYRVNPMARALPTGRTRMLALIVADITNPMFFGVMRGAERAAARRRYTLVLAESQESRERESRAADRVAVGVDGVVLVTPRMTDDQIRAMAATKPLVVINRQVEGTTAIVPDLRPGIKQALQHLHDLGHRSLAYLSGPSQSWMNTARWAELLDQAPDLGMSIVEIGTNAPTLEGGRAALRRVRASGVTAVVAYNDLMAIGLMQALQEAGVTVPGELSLIGFDDILGSTFTSPPLTTIALPFAEAGELAVQAVLEQVDGMIGRDRWRVDQSDQDGDGSPPSLLTSLVIRGSTGPVG